MKKLDANNPLTDKGFAFLLAGDHQNVVRGVLKQLGQYPTDFAYPDLFQEGCLVFVQSYVDFHRQATPADDHACLAYAYRRVHWRLLDLLRHQAYLGQHCFSADQAGDDQSGTLWERLTDESVNNLTDCQENRNLWQLLYATGTVNERRYLRSLICEQLTGTQIAAKYGVRPQTVSGWRKRVIKHARQLIQSR